MATATFRRDMAISSRIRLGVFAGRQYKPGCGVCQPVFGAIFRMNFAMETVLPAPLPTVIPAPQPSFPRKRESRGGLPRLRHYKAVPSWIPAYAGMTVGDGHCPDRHSRGNDTKKPPSPGPAGDGGKRFPWGQPSVTQSYRRVRRTFFVQTPLQVRLCRARWLKLGPSRVSW